MSAKSASYHVISHPNGGWAVKKSGSHRVTKLFGTKKDAASFARNIAKFYGELVIHDKDGRVLEIVTYGSDPVPPKAAN